MNKKTYALVSTITTAVISIIGGIVSFVNPPLEAAIIASLPILEGAIIGISANFVKSE